jgi:predicted nucleic acid-binding protein
VKTALDTNVLSALWSDEKAAALLRPLLREAVRSGPTVIAAPVCAELLAFPGAGAAMLQRFLEESGIEADFRLDEPIWMAAGHAFAEYAQRRRKSGAGGPRRLLTDFLIGAHASIRADQLLTLDATVYRRSFPALKLAP